LAPAACVIVRFIFFARQWYLALATLSVGGFFLGLAAGGGVRSLISGGGRVLVRPLARLR
jgi:hypothetical protein